jgi:cytochrome c oxidase subunit 2
MTSRYRLAAVLASVLAATLAAILAVAAQPAGAEAATPRLVEITARRFEFTPREITLERGQPVTLRLSSADVTHGFFQKELGIDATIEHGRPTDVSLTPAASGRYVVICDHFCGAGHGGMKLVITVP